jgi:5,10-methylenetetrahydromethanopterin reductase
VAGGGLKAKPCHFRVSLFQAIAFFATLLFGGRSISKQYPFKLSSMEEVTYQEEFVTLDVAYGDKSPRNIPVYIGATGPQMLELTGEICDGVVLNYVVSVDYIRSAIDMMRKGAEKSRKTIADIDRPELLVCSLSDDDPQAAMMTGKSLVAYYLGTEPHIMKASNVDEDLIKKVQEIVGWPATEADYRRAAAIIPDEVVRNLMVVGTSPQCPDKAAEYIDADVTCPILYPMMDDIKGVIDAFADWKL